MLVVIGLFSLVLVLGEVIAMHEGHQVWHVSQKHHDNPFLHRLSDSGFLYGMVYDHGH